MQTQGIISIGQPSAGKVGIDFEAIACFRSATKIGSSSYRLRGSVTGRTFPRCAQRWDAISDMCPTRLPVSLMALYHSL
jgi:hypothetical protein